MAVDANAYLTTDAVSESATPIIYGEEDVLRAKLFKAQKLPQRMDDISGMAKGAGNKIQLPEELSTWAVSTLTEGTATPVSALEFGADDLLFVWYGDAKQWTLEAQAIVFPYVLSRMRGNALQAFGENRDNIVIGELLNTTSAAIYSGTAAAGTIVAGDTFEYQQIAKARRTMEIDNLELDFVLVHPSQALGLDIDANITDNTKYAADMIEKGVMKDIYGSEIISHASVQSVTENTVTVYQALACMAKPAFYASKVEPSMDMFKENPRERAWTFHYFEAFGVKLKRNEGIIPLKSTGSL